jgi:hypothetical protein
MLWWSWSWWSVWLLLVIASVVWFVGCVWRRVMTAVLTGCHSCKWYCKVALLLTFLSWWSLAFWSPCSCLCEQVSGVMDCIPDVEKSGLLCRQEHLGFDRHGRKYWFLARRIFVYVYWMLLNFIFFYIRGPVHRESNLIIVRQDATYSVYYISIGSSTCFGCRHPSSAARTAVITVSGID